MKIFSMWRYKIIVVSRYVDRTYKKTKTLEELDQKIKQDIIYINTMIDH